jgi:hypothetical protein
MTRATGRARGRPQVDFTPDMDAKLRELRHSLHGYDACGHVIGVSPCVVKRRVLELGMPVLTRGRVVAA